MDIPTETRLKLLSAPQNLQITKEVATNLIMFDYAQSSIKEAARRAEDYRQVVASFSDISFLPTYEVEYENRKEISTSLSEYRRIAKLPVPTMD